MEAGHGCKGNVKCAAIIDAINEELPLKEALAKRYSQSLPTS